MYNILTKYLIIFTNITYKNLILYLTNDIKNKLNLINFIILVSATKNSNIFFHILDSLGNELLFYSIRSIGLSKKYNKKAEALQIYLKKIVINSNRLKTKPITAHVLNLNNNLTWFFNRLTNIITLVHINLIYKFAYNGCRKKKR
jgi:hypothetical protein